MFIGHYAVGFAIKRKTKEIPLWVLFIAVQLIDILWALLALAGVERIAFNPDQSVYLRSVYEFYPYSHSLLASIIIAGLVYFIINKYKGKRWALLIAIAILSHWFLDLIVHTPDLPILFNKYKVGLGLWNFPLASLRTEIILLGLGTLIYLWGGKLFTRKHIRTIIFLLFLFAFYITSYFAPAVVPTQLQMSLTSLVLYFLIPFGGFLIEREKK